MSLDKNNIFIILIGGIPAIGKSYLSFKILSEYKDIYDIKYLNFDLIENINKDNYLQYQQMRNDYLLKIKELLNNTNIDNNSKPLVIILDDNFFLKSMRKKIYNSIIDKILESKSIKNNIKYYFLEILLKPKDLNYCLTINKNRSNNQIIPKDVIVNMNNIFEYNSPYLNKNQSIILEINNEESLQNSCIIKDIFNNKEKYIIKQKENEEKEKEKIIIEKDNKAKLIDSIEDLVRKEVSEILKSNKNNRKKGKEISIHKKEYMKIILNNIKKIEKDKINSDKGNIINDNNNNNNENNIRLFNFLKDCVTNNIKDITQNENYIKVIKEDFNNYLNEKVIH